MAEEMRQHLDEMVRANIEDGMDPVEARFAAQRSFGGLAQIEERCRDENGFNRLLQAPNDVRYVVRSLCRARGYSLTVLTTLILGIGVTTLVYEITEWSLFRSAPYPKPKQLFFIGFKDKQNQSGYYHVGLFFEALRQQTSIFSEYAAIEDASYNVVVDGIPASAIVLSISDGGFHTLGITPALGRTFLPADYANGSDNVVVLTDLFWQQHYNRAPDVLGRTLLVDQKACTIVGVLRMGQPMPPYFYGGVYRPLVFKIDPAKVFEPSLFIIGRLRSGISPEEATAALSLIKLPAVPAWVASYFADQATVLTNINEVNRRDIWWVMVAAAVFLYAIACLNAMNLMFIRILARRRELNIRFAVGGSRWQIVQLLVVESLILSATAFAAVVVGAQWCIPLMFHFLNGGDLERFWNYWDWRTLSCIGGLSMFACAAIAIATASRIVKTDINTGLKDGGPTSGESRRARQIRTSLVIIQTAFAVVLLVGTGLMVSSFKRLRDVNIGLDPAGKVKIGITFPRGYELKPEDQLQLFERLKSKLSLLPGVRAVSYSQDFILSGTMHSIAGLQMKDGTFQDAAGVIAADDFQRAAGLTMKRGRWMSSKRGIYETVINEALARARFGDKNPIGQFVKFDVSGRQYEVVGVVQNMRDTIRSPQGMCFYTAAWVYPQYLNSIVLRLDSEPKKEFAAIIQRAVYEIDPRVTVPKIDSMDQVISNQVWAERYLYTILRGLAAIAVGLTAVGIFSVIAYTVDNRMTEFGVRMALGAAPSHLIGSVMRQGLSAAAVGFAIGGAGALALTQFMRSILFETKSYDPWVYSAVGLLLVVTAAAACWLPARKAARIDVVRLLKSG
jgi:putative ABC transport system permease protein